MTIQEFFKTDKYASLSGVELMSTEEGHAKARMEVRDIHLNAGNVVQGGAIFTLADFTFAVAANSLGKWAVSIETSIRFFKSVDSGVLFADAKMCNLHKRLATFEVRVTNEADELIALFTATAYRKDEKLTFDP
ncbi:MAG: PaaI family thioesterase [Tannerella sp.]|jgi:acyl-CoA thioesterase|nr:PaaI family thioesterase [Tannerella sp.]